MADHGDGSQPRLSRGPATTTDRPPVVFYGCGPGNYWSRGGALQTAAAGPIPEGMHPSPPRRARSRALRLLTAAVAILGGFATVGVAGASATPSAPILVYNGNASRQPGETYAGFGTATGRPISSTTTLPSDLSGTACVLLNLNQTAFSGPDVTTLATYLAGGGKVLEIAEHGLYSNNTAFNTLTTALGGTITLNGVLIDPGFGDTTSIDSDPLTRDVHRINYAASDTLTLSGTARSLVRSRSNAAISIIAAQAIGAGQLVVAGDANAFLTPSGDAAVLVADICGNRRTTAATVSCSPAYAPAGTPVTCVVTVTDTDAGTPTTPTGQITLADSGTGTGSFPGGNTCTLSAGATPGTATCSVSYLVISDGTRTVSAAYAGNVGSLGTAGSGLSSTDPAPVPPVTVTPEPPAAQTSGSSPSPATPAANQCVSRRSIVVNWRVPSGSDVRSFSVIVNGRVVATLGRQVRNVTVTLAGRTAGSAAVHVVAHGAGPALRTLRTYRTCSPKRASDGIRTLYLRAAG